MISDKNYESKLWEVLTKEHLVDLSQFHKADFYDEVPLFSRGSEIDFLSGYASDRANTMILGFALKYLKSVVCYEEHSKPYFAAITAWSSSEDGRIVPNLFVWSGPVRPLQKKLVLEEVTTSFGKRIQRYVSKKNLANRFEILEDTSSDPDESRIFISFSDPHKNFVPLGKFRKSAGRTV